MPDQSVKSYEFGDGREVYAAMVEARKQERQAKFEQETRQQLTQTADLITFNEQMRLVRQTMITDQIREQARLTPLTAPLPTPTPTTTSPPLPTDDFANIQFDRAMLLQEAMSTTTRMEQSRLAATMQITEQMRIQAALANKIPSPASQPSSAPSTSADAERYLERIASATETAADSLSQWHIVGV
jgi:hypothetical protein